MSTKMKIKVTKEVLRKSMWCSTLNNTRNVSENCAVAVAVRDIFPNARIGSHVMFFGIGFKSVDLPLRVTKFISSFDALKNKPDRRLNLPEIEFEIEIPDGVIAQIGNGNIEEVKTIIQNSETLELV